MTFLKRTALTVGLLPAFMLAPAADSASLDVNVDITLPDVIILYGYKNIKLELNADQLGPILDDACTKDDCTRDAGTASGSVNANGAVDLGLSGITINAAGTNPKITLNNSWGVRSFGIATLDPQISNIASDAAINGLAIQPINTGSTSLQTGYVEFNLDLTQVSTNNVTANYRITVTGS